MGKDMSSVDAPFGFQPWGPVLRQNLYAVETAPVIHVYTNDLVQHSGEAIVTKHGTLPTIADDAVPDSGAFLVGSVTAVFDENMFPVSHIVATEVGDGTVAGYVMVADHPDQLFVAQEDGDTNAIDLDEVGNNADIVSATICLGNANTGISTQEIDSDTAAATAALDVQLMFPHPDDTVGDDDNPNARWVVRINQHVYHDVVGLGI